MGQENTADYWMERGDGFYNNDFAEPAIRCYDKVIELDPKNSTAWYKKGVMLSSQYKQYESLAAFNIAINLSPEDSNAWNAKGLGLYIGAKHNQTVDDQLIDLNMEHPIINNKDTSMEILKGSVGHKEIWNYTFDVPLRTRRIAAGVNIADNQSELALVFEDPKGYAFEKNADLGVEKLGAQIYSPESGRWTLNVYGYGVPIEASSAFTVKFISQSYLPERFSSSLEAFDRAIELDPMSLNPMILKATVLIDCGEFEEAIKIIDNALKIDPSNPVAWETKGYILMKQENYAEAIKNINIANELYNNGYVVSSISKNSINYSYYDADGQRMGNEIIYI